MKKCLKCGKMTKSNNLTVCSMCGGNLIKADDFPEPKQCYVIEKKGSKGKTVLVVIFTIVVAVLIAVCCFLAGLIYNKNETKPSIKENKTISHKEDETSVMSPKNEDKSSQMIDDKTLESSSVTEQIADINTLPDDFDVEAEVERIREKQTDVERTALIYSEKIGGTEAWYNDEDELVRIVVEQDEEFGYARQYYYENGELYFAFVFIGADIENRLYFYSENLFRWIDGPQGEQEFHDLEFSNLEFKDWEKIVKTDAKQKYDMF